MIKRLIKITLNSTMKDYLELGKPRLHADSIIKVSIALIQLAEHAGDPGIDLVLPGPHLVPAHQLGLQVLLVLINHLHTQFMFRHVLFLSSLHTVIGLRPPEIFL